MVLLSEQRLADVIRQEVVLVWERTPSYRQDLAKTLIASMQAQQEGLSERGRRDRVKRIIEALATKVQQQAEHAS